MMRGGLDRRRTSGEGSRQARREQVGLSVGLAAAAALLSSVAVAGPSHAAPSPAAQKPAARVAPAPDLSDRYSLNARFDPATGDLRVDGVMTIVADAPTQSVELLLNRALKIDRIDCGKGCRVVIEDDIDLDGQKLPRTQRIRLSPAAALRKGDRLSVSMRYAGRLTTDDIEFGRGIVTPGWTEMSMDVLWYPVWLRDPVIRSEVLLSIPAKYDVAAPGRADRIGPGRWRLSPGVPVSGRITFAASDSWIVREQPIGKGLKARLYTVVEEPRAAEILSRVGGAYGLFQSMLGDPKTSRTSIKVLWANRDPGLKYPRQAYSTGGDFIVLDESKPDVQMDTLHHEVAHLWFSSGRPGTPDEFLSESLSEYLAMRRGEQVWGAEWLRARRAGAAERSAKVAGSLLGIDGFTRTRQPLLYNRGPTALWALHERIGARNMDRLLRDVHAADATTLAQFLGALEARHGQAAAAWFRGLL